MCVLHVRPVFLTIDIQHGVDLPPQVDILICASMKLCCFREEGFITNLEGSFFRQYSIELCGQN